MSLARANLPHQLPSPVYDANEQAVFRRAAVTADQANLKKGADVVGSRIILQSPDGTRYVLTVANGGGLSAVAL